MPRGGKIVGKGGNKKNSNLGRALVKNRFGKTGGQKHQADSANDLIHVTEEEDNNLVSVTDSNDLEAFLQNAELAGTDFTAQKANITVVDSNTPFSLRASPAEIQEEYQSRLVIPHRPPWTREMTKAELDRVEKESFLEWRRGLAALEENEKLIVTPCEKNINVWRQLWRVVERSDIVVQIVDGRNPLLFRCADLEDYVKKIDPSKKNLLLVNKADYLPIGYRKAWAAYFRSIGVDFLFWSAFAAQTQIDEELRRKNQAEDGAPEEEMEAMTLNKDDDEDESIHVYSRDELLAYFDGLVKEKNAASSGAEEGEDGAPKNSYVIGMVGYPNVGKSSTINALYGEKKVTVSSTPGKTKHFQTLILNPEITLCDCPGLVFPSFVTTRAEMVCNGVLPIDQLRDSRGPVTLVCERIPRPVLEGCYGITLPTPKVEDGEDPNRPPTAEELLSAYAFVRGYMTPRGLPDEARGARLILKDYINGRLLFCHAPPTMEGEGSAMVIQADTAVPAAELDKEMIIPLTQEMAAKVEKRQANRGKATFDTSNWTPDAEFFEQQQHVAAVSTNSKGRTIVSKNKRVQRAHEKAMAKQQAAEEAKRKERSAKKGKGAA